MNNKNIMSYQEVIKKHFEDKKLILFDQKIENGKWQNSEIKYPHILPKEYQILNLLPTYRSELNSYIEDNNLKKHIYFHHLNSSQAMCLNFFFPFYKEKELEIVLKFLGFKNEEINYEKTCFEKDSDIEKRYSKYRPTSFDFYLETISGKKIFFEIKYTEQEFGKAKLDDIHINKFNEVYKNELQFIKKEYQQINVFLKNYQILRNLICISENSYVVFLYPNRNIKIKNQAELASQTMLTDNVIDNFFNKTWEELLSFAEKNIENQNVKKQLKSFKEKYNF